MSKINSSTKIFVAGHNGLVGSAIVKNLQKRGYANIVVADRAELDLMDQAKVKQFYRDNQPELVFVAAAKVGGIVANNSCRADFIYQNLQIQNNLIWGAHEADIERLIFLGSSCIYPKLAPQPMHESMLLTGPLEETNRAYALAKIAGLELVHSLRKQYGRDYFSLMPTNLFGPNDNFNPQHSHVIPGIIHKIKEAQKESRPIVTLWGTGKPRREFMYSLDCADAIVHLAVNLDENFFDSGLYPCPQFSHINIGVGYDISIAEVAEMIREMMQYQGSLRFDSTFPDGAPRKLLDVSILEKAGWKSQTSFRDALKTTIDWYQSQQLVRT